MEQKDRSASQIARIFLALPFLNLGVVIGFIYHAITVGFYAGKQYLEDTASKCSDEIRK